MATVELEVEESGQGRPVVLLHAFPLSRSMWSAARPGLGADCRVITPDLRGFGDSPLGADEPSVELMADDVAAVLDRLGLASVVLGGLSMGGYVAMAFLRRHPERVSTLVLADTKASPDPTAAAENRLRIADVLAREKSSRVLVEEVLPKLVGPTTRVERPGVLDRVRAEVMAAPPRAAAWAQRAMAARPDSLETLRRAGVPGLVIVGAEDELATEEDARAMRDALPQGRLVTLAGSGHLTAVETPEAFAAAVHDFLSAQDGRTPDP